MFTTLIYVPQMFLFAHIDQKNKHFTLNNFAPRHKSKLISFIPPHGSTHTTPHTPIT